MANELREASASFSIFHKGEAYSAKIGSPKDFLKYKLLSLKNKKDLIQIFLYASSLAKALNIDDPTTKTFELERESAAEYLLREYDCPFLETIAYPNLYFISDGLYHSSIEVQMNVAIKAADEIIAGFVAGNHKNPFQTDRHCDKFRPVQSGFRFQVSARSSFPRTRESREVEPPMDSRVRGNDGQLLRFF